MLSYNINHIENDLKCQQEKDTLCRKIFDAACFQLGVFLTIKIKVEPMCQFYLEEDANQVLSLLLRDVNNESTEKEKHSGYTLSLYNCNIYIYIYIYGISGCNTGDKIKR